MASRQRGEVQRESVTTKRGVNRPPARKRAKLRPPTTTTTKKKQEETTEDKPKTTCKHFSFKSFGHRTACLADIWESYTDRRLENASGTQGRPSPRKLFFLELWISTDGLGKNYQNLQCLRHFMRPTSPRTQPSLLLSDRLFSLFLPLFASSSPPFLSPTVFLCFLF